MTTAPDDADSFDADDFEVLPPTAARPVVPLGGTGAAIATWFETVVVVAEPIMDGSLDAERAAAKSFQRLAKAENTRRAYKAAVKAWCAWCTRHSLPPSPPPESMSRPSSRASGTVG